jgi:cytochrome c
MKLSVLCLLAGLISFATGVHAAGGVTRGARAFQSCASCHSLQAGRHLTGPSLANVWGRKAGTAEGFLRYSDALKNSGIVWNDESLQRWLADPQAMVPGNAMPFAGIHDAQARADLVAYLHAVSEGKAPAPQSSGGMMGGMMGGGESADLRKAGDDAQVASIRHCRDTYVVRTRGGTTQKIWEYNLRLKTDSSTRGPRKGVPVIVGSGMKGDRFSIVFASPAEISRSVREDCN